MLSVSIIYDHSTIGSVWTPPTSTKRQQCVYDLRSDSSALHYNVGLDIVFLSNDYVTLYEWQPSFFVTPEDTFTRPTDWTDAGTPGYKFVHGVRIDADTNGSARTVQVQYDGGTVGPTLTINHAGELIKPYSFAPFKAHLIRLVPTDTSSWRLFGVAWDIDPEPEPTGYWVTQPMTFDLPGYLHIRDVQFAYASTAAGVVLSVVVDGTSYQLASLPSTGGAESKVYIVAPPIKGKLWQLQATGTNLQVYERDCEFRLKSWGSDSYQIIRPIGEVTATSGGAKI